MLLWLVTGMYGGPVVYGIVPLTMIFMRNKGLYEELLLGFFFVLILSDSLEDRLFFAKNLKNIYVTLLAVFVLFDLKNFQPLNNLYKVFIPFFIFSFLTMIFSVNEAFFFTSLQKTLSYFLVFLIIPNFIDKLFRERKEQFYRSFLLFAITTLIFGFVLRYFAHDVAYIETGRYRGIMGNPNGLGIYCVFIFIIFFVVNDFYPGLFSRGEIMLFYGAILYSILLCGSRNAFFAVILFLLFQRFFGLSPFLGFIFFMFFLVLAEVINNNLAAIIVSLELQDFFRLKTLEDGSGRYVAWEFAWGQIQENFFVGKGFAYNEYFMRQHYRELGKMGHQGGIHNSFLTFWMDQGLIGLLIYLRSFILMFIKASRKTKFAFPIMFSIMFTAMFESWLVGSLSAYAFLAMFIYTLINNEAIVPQVEESKNQVLA